MNGRIAPFIKDIAIIILIQISHMHPVEICHCIVQIIIHIVIDHLTADRHRFTQSVLKIQFLLTGPFLVCAGLRFVLRPVGSVIAFISKHSVVKQPESPGIR